MYRRNTWIGIPCAITAAIASFSCLDAFLKRRIQEQPHGNFTSAQILCRIRTLRTLSLLPASAIQNANTMKVYNSHGKVKQFWYVECSEEDGQFAGYARWDADSGELCVLSRCASPSPFPVPDLTRAQAISQARLLLKQPGIGLPAEQWHLYDSPTVVNDFWHVNMTSSLKRAYISLNMNTGQIAYLHIWSQVCDEKPLHN